MRKMPVIHCLLLSAAILGAPLPAAGHQEAASPPGVQSAPQPTLEEKTGAVIPLDLVFRDEEGKTVRLGDIISRPVILSLIYYTCEHICPQLLVGLATATDKLALSPGRDYQVLIVSFDETDTPKTAADLRRNYLKAAKKTFPGGSWKFLTGDGENIKRLTDAAGFRFRREGHGFIHPSALIILSPEGKIARYIHTEKVQYGVAYPVTFSALDLETALRSASRGEIAAGKKGKVFFCFPGEPEEQARFFTILSIAGSATLLILVSLFLYLTWTGKKFRRKEDHGAGT